jgi:raffinose/stachyose/melibiose transport system permease protein
MRQPGRSSRTATGWWRRALTTLPALMWAAIILIPILVMISIAFRTSASYSADPIAIPHGLTLGNFARAWIDGNLFSAFVNTAIITVASVLLIVAIGSLASYSIVRWVGSGGNRLYVYFALGLIVPFQLGLPTLYKIWAQLGLVDNLFGVILIQVGAGLPFAIFLYSGFLRTVPLELEESAKLDGASDLRTFVSIVFPLLRPATATVVILEAIAVWNDLIVSLYFLQSTNNQTLPKATIGFQSLFNNDTPVIFACAILTVIPIIAIFISLQRFFLSGLTAGALRS